MLTQKDLKEKLYYNPESGEFTWLKCDRPGWSGKRAGYTNGDGYVFIGIADSVYLAHRLAWLYMTGKWPDLEIDHKDTKPSNNRWDNLREATSQINKENRQTSTNATGLLGAYPYRDRFKASIRTGYRQIHLGVFDTPDEAHAAYVMAKRKLHRGCMI